MKGLLVLGFAALLGCVGCASNGHTSFAAGGSYVDGHGGSGGSGFIAVSSGDPLPCAGPATYGPHPGYYNRERPHPYAPRNLPNHPVCNKVAPHPGAPRNLPGY